MVMEQFPLRRLTLTNELQLQRNTLHMIQTLNFMFSKKCFATNVNAAYGVCGLQRKDHPSSGMIQSPYK